PGDRNRRAHHVVHFQRDGLPRQLHPSRRDRHVPRQPPECAAAATRRHRVLGSPATGHYTIILSFWRLLVVLGMYEPVDLVDEMREALRRAEAFGDICGIITAQFAYGTAILR